MLLRTLRLTRTNMLKLKEKLNDFEIKTEKENEREREVSYASFVVCASVLCSTTALISCALFVLC